MRIFNKMKKAMLVMMASLFCANVAFAEVKTVTYIQDDSSCLPSTEQTVSYSLDGISFSYLVDTGWSVKEDKREIAGVSYTNNVGGKQNPTVGEDGVPTGGSVMGFLPQYDGQLEVAVIVNGGKAIYIREDGVAIDGVTNEGVAVSEGTKLDAKLYGSIKFDVKAGKQYYLYCTGSKMSYYGFVYTYEEPAKVAYLCGATETTEAIYTSLVNAGMEVTPLNYDEVSLTDADVETLAAYDLVVLAGNTGSGTNLAKTANLLVGKVNVLSTKSFWYKHYGTNGGNPGTADTPSLSLTKSIAGHPIFAGIEGDEFAVFNDMAKSSGRYLQSNGSFNETVGLTQTALAQTNGVDCIGEGWLNGKGYLIIPVDGVQPAGYLTAAGEILFANAAKYLVAGEQYVAIDLASYNQAVADAEAFKATLNAEDVIEADVITIMDEAIAGAAMWLEELEAEGEYTQEDVDMIAEDLNANTAKWSAYINMKKAETAAQEILMRYPEDTRVDNAGLVDALKNLPLMVMWETAESLQGHADAVNTAAAAFEKENNQLILDAAKKKATDYAATLDASEETGTAAQMEAYGTLTYYTSDEFFAENGITADSYDMVISYRDMIDQMLAMYQPAIEKEKTMMAATKATAEAQETMASYDNATDNAGLASAIAKVNEILGELNMWDTMYTIEDLNAAVDALAAARVAFEKENGLNEGVTYYMKNVASGKFMNGGNDWGTRASLLEHGFDVTLVAQEEGKYAIDTNVPNGAKRYLGSNGYVDSDLAAWILTRVSGRTYTISLDGVSFIGSDGSSIVNMALTDAADAAAQWQFITKDELIAGMADATVENPVDATFFIVGQNFNRSDNNRNAAWQGSPTLGGDNTNYCAEKWNTNFDVYQDLAGLPNGYYKVSVQGYYRAGNGGATAMDRNAYLYAGTSKTPLVNINSEAGNAVFDGLTGWAVSDVAGMGLVPNNMATASTAFTNGLYADNSVIVEVTDGTLRIGVKKDVLISNDWTIFDNFELTYFGTELPPVVADGTYYMKNVASGKFLNGGNSWGTQASLVDNGFDAILTYSNGTYTIDTNVPNGVSRHFLGSNGYVDSDVANWKVVPAGENYAITLDGVNYIGYNGENSVMALNLTDAANTAAQWQFLTKDELIAGLDGATEANPADATFFIVGQNFNRGDANRNAAWQGSPALGGNNVNFCAEKWNTNFDIYQDLTGLPNGYYVLSAQAFYRAGGNAVVAENKDVKNVSLYAGANSVPVMSVLDEAGKEGISGATNIEGFGIVPNNMTEASNSFSAGLYAGNEVLVLVKDGTLRVGIKKDVTINDDWAIFDNFELAYIGTGVPSAFAPAVDSLNKVLAEVNTWKATLDANNEIEAQVIAQIEQGMMPAAQAVATQPASIAEVEEMIATVNMFLLQTQTSVAQYKAMEAMQLMAEYENPKDNVGFEEAYNEVFMIANGLATGTYTWADVEVAIAKMNAAQELFVLQNVPTPAVEIVNVLGKHRLVALTCDHVVPVEIFYSYDEDMAKTAIYTAPFYVSETTTVYAYAQFIDEDRVRYTSDKVAIEIEAGEEVALNAPVVEKTEAGNIKLTTDQTKIAGAPNDTIEYLFYPQVEEGVYAINPSASGYYTEELTAEMLGGSVIGKIVAKAIAFGYTTSETVQYLVGETEVTMIEATDNPFGIEGVEAGQTQWPADIYDVNGRMVKKAATSLEGLEKGLYFIKGQKVLVK